MGQIRGEQNRQKETKYMILRKIITFNTAVGITLPKEITSALGFKHGDYAEIYLRDSKTVIIKRHGTPPKNITLSD